MSALTIRRVGNSLGVILPKEVLTKLKVVEGDKIYLSDAPGGMRVTASNAEFEQQMKIAEQVMHEYRDVLRELAK
jgi:putative addiction module antidote